MMCGKVRMLFGRSVDDSWSRVLQLWEVSRIAFTLYILGCPLTRLAHCRAWPINRGGHASATRGVSIAEQHDRRRPQQPQLSVLKGNVDKSSVQG